MTLRKLYIISRLINFLILNEELLLYKGLNFSIPSKRLKFENYQLPFELLYQEVYDIDNRDKSLLHLKNKGYWFNIFENLRLKRSPLWKLISGRI